MPERYKIIALMPRAIATLREGLGAKLGANLCGPQRTTVNACGSRNPQTRDSSTLVDTSGRRLEIYGSGGWVLYSDRGWFVEVCLSAARCLGRPSLRASFGTCQSASASLPRSRT